MANLKLVIVLCRHGDRTPLHAYPKDPYSLDEYLPLLPGELTNLGKKRMYGIGKALRNRYDKFLGDTNISESVKVVTTEIDRTKMTAQLVCAGLFPPSAKQKFEETLNWQPIPYSYNSSSFEMFISPIHRVESFRQLYKEVEKSEYGQEIYKKFDSVFKYLEEKSGFSPCNIMHAFQLYIILTAQESFGLVLPEWTKKVFPDPLNEIASYQYVLENYNLNMKQQTTGSFVSELIDDFDKKINGESKLKFILYSAHECSVANLLIILNLFDLKVPNFGSYVTLELREHNNQHFIKIYYHNSDSGEPKLLKIPEFEESCPYDLFKTYLSKYIIKT